MVDGGGMENFNLISFMLFHSQDPEVRTKDAKPVLIRPADEILIPKIPALAPSLHFFLAANGGSGKFESRIEVVSPDGGAIGHTWTFGFLKDPRNTAWVYRRFPRLKFREFGHHRFRWLLDDQEVASFYSQVKQSQ